MLCWNSLTKLEKDQDQNLKINLKLFQILLSPPTHQPKFIFTDSCTHSYRYTISFLIVHFVTFHPYELLTNFTRLISRTCWHTTPTFFNTSQTLWMYNLATALVRRFKIPRRSCTQPVPNSTSTKLVRVGRPLKIIRWMAEINLPGNAQSLILIACKIYWCM